ncbi:phage portal protein [Hydrogenovibrio marinus]|uniref:Capsid portal protein n=1 Tax=Hydrogenovibrio marinus TaxID=28885 RepID=A0A066ZMW6_HYDMR|nr:phage portal protein [Hydrogenovibrio marinus]KDN94852.1 capsid portal protein [Hydrogenovibrio marinus]BBN59312.1 phage portal protein [Hydrogenovibrio marinus]
MSVKFGDPVSVRNESILDYAESALFDGYYEPPISLEGLAQSTRANSTHSSAIFAKRNLLLAVMQIKSKDLLSRKDLKNFILDFRTFGNAYLNIIRNGFGKIVKLKHLPALYMRREEDLESHSFRTSNQTVYYPPGTVWSFNEYDVTQEIYGVPEWFATLSAVWLNEDATLFRRKYYMNGAHSGFLLYMNNANLSDKDEEEIIKALNSQKGLGNFKNLFINGKGKDTDKTKPELIPVGKIDARDEFLNIKNVSKGDILTAHRIPLELMSVVQDGFNTSTDLNKVDRIFYKNELLPIAESLIEVNDELRIDLLDINEYQAVE